MFNPTNVFNGLFGKVSTGMCRLTVNGEIAVKCSNGYKSYSLKQNRLTNVTNFCFDLGEEFFFVLPTSKVERGDIILVEGKPKCVLSVTKGDKANGIPETIKVIDYDSSEIREIVPERHVFMGQTYFYGKIFSMFGSTLKGGKGINNILKMSMISSVFGGNKTNDGGMFGGNMGQMMAMSMLMGGKDNMFSDMFDGLSFDTPELESNTEATETEEA